MSFDAQNELKNELRKNQALVELAIGGFHNRKAMNTTVYPQVVYTEINNADDRFTDNEAISSEVRFQLSIYSKGEMLLKENSIAKELDKIMKQLNYKRYSSVDLYEEDTKVYHKAMRYEKTFI